MHPWPPLRNPIRIVKTRQAGRFSLHRTLLVSVTVAVALVLAPGVQADEGYLSTGESVGLGLTSAGIFGLGHLARRASHGTPARWSTPPSFDASISRWLGGTPKPGKRNFLDNNFGSAITTISAATLVLTTDVAYPRNDRTKDILQNQFVFFAGAYTNKGVTDIFKGLFRRQRPIGYFASEILEEEGKANNSGRNHAFFSGHASSAFYAMSFLNLHLRGTMRREMSSGDFRDWSWLPPLVTYGWSSFVAYSRIQAYQHYLTDVLAGAIAGTVIGLLYYQLVDDVRPAVESGAPIQFKLHFGIDI